MGTTQQQRLGSRAQWPATPSVAQPSALRRWWSGRLGGPLFAEMALMAALFLGYRQVRYLTKSDVSTAMANASEVVRLERDLGMFTERAVQRVVMHSETLVHLLNRYYVMVHFPATIAFILWAFVRHQAAYRLIRAWFLIVTAAALAIHVAYPLAPPRMLRGHGFVDTLRIYGPQIYSTDTTKSIANQFAAMPSLHFGWALLVAIGVVHVKRHPWSYVVLLHPVITLMAIVATANHYWLDAGVAIVLVAIAVVVVAHVAASDRVGEETFQSCDRGNLAGAGNVNAERTPDACQAVEPCSSRGARHHLPGGGMR
jgi:hypothetical protein